MPRRPKYSLYRKKGKKTFTLGKLRGRKESYEGQPSDYYGIVEGINLKQAATSKKTTFTRGDKLLRRLFGGE